MRENDLGRLFQRFRDDGDVAALAIVFDRTAPDLLELARHLLRHKTVTESEDDLVQATFVSAIESRASYDASRRLEPWLAGILANHASLARRRARRILPEPQMRSLGTASEESPESLALDRELWSEVSRAVESLPPVYREVVASRVIGGERSVEIAKRSGRSGGVVRAQLHRGLTLLRRGLPSGLFASLVAFVSARCVLGSTRSAVLASARQHALSLSTSPATATTTAVAATGALVMLKKVAFGLVAIAMLFVGYLVMNGDPGAAQNDPQPTPPAPVAPVVATTDPKGAPPQRERVATRNEETAAPTPVALPASYVRALAGVKGRLVEYDGRPAANTALEAFQFDRDRFTFGVDAAFTKMKGIEGSARTRTDDAGRFFFDGLEPNGIHAIMVDHGGPRATLKLLDIPLSSGTQIDLGDVVLGPVALLRGRVVDEDGEPIGGARIRVAPLPTAVFSSTGIERVTPESIVLTDAFGTPTIEALPIWMRNLLAQLPLPTTTSMEDGRFELAGIPPGNMSVVIDAKGYVTSSFGADGLVAGKERDLGELELPLGRTIVGTVVDGEKKPIAGAQLAAGVGRGIAFLSLRAETDDQGRFEIRNLPDDGVPVLIARPTAASQWRRFETSGETAAIEMSDLVDHVVRVRRSDGAPVHQVGIRLAPMAQSGPPSAVERDDDWAEPVIERSASEPGTLRLKRLFSGNYHVLVRVDDLGSQAGIFEISKEHGATEFVFTPPRSLRVAVVDAATNEKVEHAEVAIFSPDDLLIEVASAFTNASGTATLAPLAYAPGARQELRIRHPGYAMTRFAADPGVDECIVRLTRGGALEGAITASGAPPSERYVVILRPAMGSGAIPLPIFVAADATGAFKASNLPPMKYAYDVFPNFLAADFRTASSRVSTDFGIMNQSPEARGNVTIESGATARLDIEIVPRGSPLNGVVHGRVTYKGTPLPTAKLFIDGQRDQLYKNVDANGEFEFTDIPPGEIEIQCYVKADAPIAIHTSLWKKVKLAPGGAETIDFHVGENDIRVRLMSGGTPLADMPITLRRTGGKGAWIGMEKTNAAGEATMRASEAGEHSLTLADPDRGYVAKTVNVVDDSKGIDVTLELEPGITIAGKVKAKPAYADLRILRVRAAVNGSELTYVCPLDPNRGFRIDHAPPGKLTFELTRDDGESPTTTLDVGTSREDLSIEFP